MTRLGEGSNNFVELLSFKLLLIFVAEKGFRSLKVYGDSLNVINWIKRIQHCRDLRLENILLSILAVINSYDSFSCEHVYKENNCQADNASKAGLQLATSQWKIKEWLDNTFYEYSHCPFIEDATPQLNTSVFVCIMSCGVPE